MTKQALSEVRMNRTAFVRVTPELLLDLLKVPAAGVLLNGQRLSVAGGIPETATALRAGVGEYGDVLLIFQDDSLPEVVEGAPRTMLSPLYFVESELDDAPA